MKNDVYPFDGWDWTELAKAWNVYIPDDYWIPGMKGYHETAYDHSPVIWLIESALKQYDGQRDTRVMRKLANDCRVYLKRLGDEENSHTYSGPMWLGMSQIESDWTLLQFVHTLIGYMWD